MSTAFEPEAPWDRCCCDDSRLQPMIGLCGRVGCLDGRGASLRDDYLRLLLRHEAGAPAPAGAVPCLAEPCFARTHGCHCTALPSEMQHTPLYHVLFLALQALIDKMKSVTGTLTVATTSAGDLHLQVESAGVRIACELRRLLPEGESNGTPLTCACILPREFVLFCACATSTAAERWLSGTVRLQSIDSGRTLTGGPPQWWHFNGDCPGQAFPAQRAEQPGRSPRKCVVRH